MIGPRFPVKALTMHLLLAAVLLSVTVGSSPLDAGEPSLPKKRNDYTVAIYYWPSFHHAYWKIDGRPYFSIYDVAKLIQWPFGDTNRMALGYPSLWA